MKKVMAFGTFDCLHPGHLFFLRQAKNLGDYLIVVIARDTTVLENKKHPPLQSENDRLASLQSYTIADRVMLGSTTDVYESVRTESPDVIALGYDQTFFTENLAAHTTKQTKIIRLPSLKPEIYKTSILSRKTK